MYPSTSNADMNFITKFSDVEERRSKGIRFKENSVRQILDFYPELACLCYDGKIEFLNESGASLLGFDNPEDAFHTSFNEFLVDNYAGLKGHFIALLLEEDELFPARLRKTDGDVISMNISVQWARELGSDAGILKAQDITQRLSLLEEIKESESRFRHLIDNAIDLFCACDRGKINFINKTGLELLGADNADQIIGRPISDLFHADYKSIFLDSLPELSQENMKLPAKLNRLDGASIDVHVKVTSSYQGGSDSFMLEVRDISEHRRAVMTLHQTNQELEQRVINRTQKLSDEVERRREAEEQMRQMATHDSLTGLPNRAQLIERLDREITEAEKSGDSFAVLFIDLDGFKSVNDGLGHEAGDLLLQQVAMRLLKSIREEDVAARIGGDEFVVTLMNVDDRAVIENRARIILDSLTNPFSLDDDREANIGGSIGVAIFPADGSGVDKLLKSADKAMYEVKNSGKNNIAFAN